MNLRNEIKTETLLSSTTYKTDKFDKCIWCDKEVENDYYEFNDDYYQPWRCNCEKAKIELQKKLNLLNTLLDLRKDMVMNLKVDDFVEGYEYYGETIRKTKGWVDKIDSNGNIHIQAWDNYKGHRGTILFAELGEIVFINSDFPRPII